MTTPTDPYSRPSDDDKHEDVLGPLGNDSSEDQPREDSWRNTNEDETVPAFLSRDRFDDDNDEPIDSTQAWKPNFDDYEENDGQASEAENTERPIFDDGHHEDADHNQISETDGHVEDVETERDPFASTESDHVDETHSDLDRETADKDHTAVTDSDNDHTVVADDKAHHDGETVIADRDEVRDDYDSDRWDREFGDDNDGDLRGDIAGHRDETDHDTTDADTTGDDAAATTALAGTGTAAATTTGEAPTRTSVFARPEAGEKTDKTEISEARTADEAPAYGEKTQVAPVAGTAPRTEFPTRPVREHTVDVPDEPHGRGWAHVGVFFATLLLAPFAWYLVADAGVRLGVLENSQWSTGNPDWMSILELVGALACLGILWYLAAFSSVGANFFGLILFAAGMAALIAPSTAQDLLGSSAFQSFADFNTFTGNVAHHLTNDLATGRIAVYGFLLMMTGVVSHYARRKGADRGGILATRRALLSKNTDT